MPRVALILGDLGPAPAECIVAIAKCLRVSIAEVRDAAEHKRPVAERELFDPSESDILDAYNLGFPKRLEQLLVDLQALSCELKVYEFASGETWSSSAGRREIDLTVLRNIVQSHILAHDEAMALLELGHD